jgi:hypothetical protein
MVESANYVPPVFMHWRLDNYKLFLVSNIFMYIYMYVCMYVCVCVFQEIGKMLTLAADTIHELSQPSPSSEKVDYKTKDFLKTVEVSLNYYVGVNTCIAIRNLAITYTSPKQLATIILLPWKWLLFIDCWIVSFNEEMEGEGGFVVIDKLNCYYLKITSLALILINTFRRHVFSEL